MGVHDGHRERMRKRFKNHGLDNFEDHNVLEMLLFYVITRKDTNELAHEMLNHFGSLNRVFEASINELMSVDGVGENVAIFLTLIPAICRRYMLSKNDERSSISTSSEAGEYMTPLFMFETEEVVYMICLDNMNRVNTCREVGRGAPDSVVIDMRKIAEISLVSGCRRVIIAHNHVDGVMVPSFEDEMTTRRLREALDALDIEMVDHIIVCGSDYISMSDSGFLENG